METIIQVREDFDDGRVDYLTISKAYSPVSIKLTEYQNEDDEEPINVAEIKDLSFKMAEILRDYLNFLYPKK